MVFAVEDRGSRVTVELAREQPLLLEKNCTAFPSRRNPPARHLLGRVLRRATCSVRFCSCTRKGCLFLSLQGLGLHDKFFFRACLRRVVNHAAGSEDGITGPGVFLKSRPHVQKTKQKNNERLFVSFLSTRCRVVRMDAHSCPTCRWRNATASVPFFSLGVAINNIISVFVGGRGGAVDRERNENHQ